MPHDHIQDRIGGYPCRVACLWCDPAPVFDFLDRLAEHYIREHPISVLVPLPGRRVVRER